MNIASILIATKAANMMRLSEKINDLPWAEVHYSSEDGRMIATIEGDNSEEDIAHFKTVKNLPDVLDAKLIQYCFEEEAADSLPESQAVVPEYLADDSIGTAGPSEYQSMRRLSNF